MTVIYPRSRTIYSSLPMQVFMIHAIKQPLLKLAGLIADKIPEPTKENTWHPNSHNLIEIRDEFFKHCELDIDRKRLIRIVFNFLIILYDFDPPWRMMMDWVKDEAFKREWKPRLYGAVMNKSYPWWKEEKKEQP